MTMRISPIRPGLLVSLKSAVTGNVTYQKKDLEAPHLESDGALVSLWETERSVARPVEHEEAIKVRSKCRSLITGICSASSFGLLCLESNSDQLSERIIEAQGLAEDFNRRAELTRISVFVIIGRVAQDDVQAVRAINSEIRDLMDTMERGLQKLDVKVIRDAANKAKELGSMLSAEASEKVEEAIKVARSAARQIVKAAETGAAQVDQAVLTKIRASRTAFLDYSDADTEIATPEHVGRAIDLAPDEAEIEPVVSADPVQRMYDEAFEDAPINVPAPKQPAAIELE